MTPNRVALSLGLAVLCLAPRAIAEEAPPDAPPAPEAPAAESPPPAAAPAEPAPASPPAAPAAAPAPWNQVQLLGAPLRFNGYFWVDTGYMARTNAQAGQYDQDAAYMQGRFVLGATYRRDFEAYFGDAHVELLGLVNEYAKSQYEPHTLDAYVRLGHQKWWDVQVGRFLAWEVFHRGQGIELWTAEEAGALGGPALYWLDYTRGFKNEAGQAAVHFYPLSALGFEVAGVYGQESNQNNVGVRPVVDFRFKGLELIGGYEYYRQIPQTEADKVESTSQGWAARAQYSVGPVTFGANAAQAFVRYIDIQGLEDTEKSFHKLSLGGFVDIDFWKNSIGLGYLRTNQHNKQEEDGTHDQAFVSYLFRLPIDGLSLKGVYGFARAHVEDSDTDSSWDNYLHSFRLRIGYEFQ